MVHTDPQILTTAQLEILQRAYLWGRIHGRTAQVSDVTLEPDGRRRSKVVKEAVAAGFLKEIGKDSWHGSAFEVTTQILRTVQPQEPNLQDTWTKLYEKYSHRDAYTRPWIRFEDLLIAEQFQVIESELVDWFVVSSVPYEYHAFFGDDPETVVTDATAAQAYNRYFAGPFSTMDEAVIASTGKPTVGLAVSSPALREMVASRFAEEKVQRLFASNLIWGLVTLGIVPNDVIISSTGKPTINSQLIEGHPMRFSADAESPCSRLEVRWEENLAESIERIKTRIEQLQSTLEQLRTIDRGINNFGGWNLFKDKLEQQLRATP